MLKDRYIKYKYEKEFAEHFKDNCDCDLTDGGKGRCLYGQYLEESIDAEEFLKAIGDEYYDLQYGTFIRTITDDVAVVIGVIRIAGIIYLKLDREVILDRKDISKKANILPCDKIKKHSNILKKLVQIGDIANGNQIIDIKDGILFYGHWGNERIIGEVKELLTRNNYDNDVVLS